MGTKTRNGAKAKSINEALHLSFKLEALEFKCARCCCREYLNSGYNYRLRAELGQCAIKIKETMESANLSESRVFDRHRCLQRETDHMLD